jgi:four helix bundle protein
MWPKGSRVTRRRSTFSIYGLRTHSGAELETQLIVGTRIGVVKELEAEALITDAAEVGRMINGLVRSLERAR